MACRFNPSTLQPLQRFNPFNDSTFLTFFSPILIIIIKKAPLFCEICYKRLAIFLHGPEIGKFTKNVKVKSDGFPGADHSASQQ